MTTYHCDSCPARFSSFADALAHTRANKGHDCTRVEPSLTREEPPLTREEPPLTRFAQVVFSFPSLLDAAERGYLRTDVEDHELARQLAAFVASPAATSGSTQAAKFCLAVWGGTSASLEEWGLKAFDIMRAVSSLDESHRRALIAWFEDPYFP